MTEPAQGTLEKIREEITCPVCQELFRTPKTLPCLHTFCESCLKGFVEARAKQRKDKTVGAGMGPGEAAGGGNGSVLECPSCRAVFDQLETIDDITTNFTYDNLVEHMKIHDRLQSEEGLRCGKCVEEFDAPAIAFCYECKAALCDFCYKMHDRVKELQAHNCCSLSDIKAPTSMPPTSLNPRRIRCQKHLEEMRWFCSSCMEVICRDCAVKDHRHHDFEFIPEVVGKERREIQKRIEPLQLLSEKITEACKRIVGFKDELKKAERDKCAEIEEAAQKSIELVKERAKLMKEYAEELYRAKAKNLDIQFDDLESTQTAIVSTLEFATTTLQKGSDVEVLMYKKDFVARSDHLMQSQKSISLEVLEEDNIRFVHDPNMASHFGKLSEAACPEKCKVEGQGIEQNLMQGEEVSVVLTAKTAKDQQLIQGGGDCTSEVFCTPPPPLPDKTFPASVTDNSNGTYTITYTPEYPGTNKLHVRFDGEEVCESPFEVEVVRNYEGSSLRMERDIYTIPNASPWGLTVLPNQHLAVSASDCLVHIFNIEEGVEVSIIRSNFTRPYAMAVDANDDLWVTDREAHNVQKFSRDGKKLHQFGQRGPNGGQFSHPRGIAIHPTNGNIYISDMKNNRIQVFSPDATYLKQFGCPGKNTAQFNLPAGLCFNREEQLVVCDDHNCRLQVFDAEGNFLHTLGVAAGDKGLLCSPIGVACDPHGRYVVTEFGSHCVSFLSPEGEILNCVRTVGSGYGQFVHPRGVTVDNQGYVYIADNENMRIVRF